MPARRVPTALLAARGGYEGHADRKAKRANEPKIAGKLGAPPSFMTPDQQGVWTEIASWFPAGVLTAADRFAVERAVVLMVETRVAAFHAAREAELRKWLGVLGATPTDRSRVVAPPAPQKKSRLAEALALQ